MKLLEQIRNWKNKHFSDFIWDLLIGLLCVIFAIVFMLIPKEFYIIIIPFIITAINQYYNRLFELKDFVLRMAIPLIIFVIQYFI